MVEPKAMLQNICLRGLWISTLAILLLTALQGLSGHWIIFFLLWPGGPATGHTFIQAMGDLSTYHRIAGFVIGALSILVLFFAFYSRSTIYVRVLAILGLAMTALAASGGILYFNSRFLDRWSLGQMADAFVGVFAAYFIQLFFMNGTPRFPWNRAKSARRP
jgi:hypothetical protein